jgi:hypothetical protein
MLDLTGEEIAALIEACNVAGDHGAQPAWDRAGQSAWAKLIEEERNRATLLPIKLKPGERPLFKT